MINVLQTYVPCLQLDDVATKLFADGCAVGTFILDFLEAQGAKEIEFREWVDVESADQVLETTLMKLREVEVSFRFPLPPVPLCPRSTRVTNMYRCAWTACRNRQALIIDCTSSSHDIPFADYFSVQDQIRLETDDHGMLVSKAFTTEFVKRTMLRGRIEAGTLDAQRKSCDILLSVLRRYADSSVTSNTAPEIGIEDSDGNDCDDTMHFQDCSFNELDDDERWLAMYEQSTGDCQRCPRLKSEETVSTDVASILEMESVHTCSTDDDTLVIEVFELQRRTSIFHDDWRAPFLPHDRSKRWRWVDSDYSQHPCCDQHREDARASDKPPLVSPGGWRFDSMDWIVDEQLGPADEDGWQYASEFYKAGSRWGSSPQFYGCRRRRSIRTCIRATEHPRSCIVEAWELQRRTTVFHSDWRAPFLPHDGEKKCRWVDADYKQHPWAASKRLESALSDTPAIEAPPGWKSDGNRFVVATSPAPCDEDGWQYAVDFYRSAQYWGASPKALHCRRRLWRCYFQELISC